MAEIERFVSWVVGPNVLKKAHSKESTKISTVCCHGKKN